MQPVTLRCEYLVNPLGIDELKPRLSWTIKTDEYGLEQKAYQILVASSPILLNQENGDLWESGKIYSNHMNQIEYNGIKLISEQWCYWKVRIWNQKDQPSEWSEIAYWSMGLLQPSDWHAKWIGAPSKDTQAIKSDHPPQIPCPLLRKTFSMSKKVHRAILYMTALGEYEAYLNGHKVGDHILAPEWTEYSIEVQYQTYDVTDLLHEGFNCISAILADGWYIGYLGPGDRIRHGSYGTDRRFLAELKIEYTDTEKVTFLTDKSWRIYEEGPIRSADHFMGEVIDTRLEPKGWQMVDFDESASIHKWEDIIEDNSIQVKMIAQMNEPIRIIEKIKPIAVTEPKPGLYIFDIGQNMVGWCELNLEAPIGTEIVIRHGEMLELDGTLHTINLRFAKATDRFIVSQTGLQTYHPHFTYHGFRYVEITGVKFSGLPPLDSLQGCAFASDTPITGSFESSNPKLNQLFRNILWTQRDNLISIPTDCPQRNERMGWMGDAQVFCQAATLNMDMAAFYSKFCRDIRNNQLPDGRYPDFAPNPAKTEEKFMNSPAWADAGVIIPWTVYQNYGDTRILSQNYESIKKFIDYVSAQNPDGIWIKGVGNNYGDWLNGNTIKAKGYPKRGGQIPKDLFATAYYAHSVQISVAMARILGHTDDVRKYETLYAHIVDQIKHRFINRKGKIKGDTQAGYALLLHFNLLPKELREIALQRLVKAIRKYNNRISTGFCTTTPMMYELIQGRQVDLAYELLLSKKFPSWFYMIDQGATTMWERWDGFVQGRGFQNPGMNSFNHYSIGAIGEWLYRIILGIQLDPEHPGYRRFLIKPILGGNLSSAYGIYRSIVGTIGIEWRIEQPRFRLKVNIPANTTAVVCVPTKDPSSIREISGNLDLDISIKRLGSNNNYTRFLVTSGSYEFISTL